ncbi:hypothetical protein KKA47_00500 [bacterium]|nr:hypothetical protein [bacterium]
MSNPFEIKSFSASQAISERDLFCEMLDQVNKSKKDQFIYTLLATFLAKQAQFLVCGDMSMIRNFSRTLQLLLGKNKNDLTHMLEQFQVTTAKKAGEARINSAYLQQMTTDLQNRFGYKIGRDGIKEYYSKAEQENLPDVPQYDKNGQEVNLPSFKNEAKVDPTGLTNNLQLELAKEEISALDGIVSNLSDGASELLSSMNELGRYFRRIAKLGSKLYVQSSGGGGGE